MSLQQQYGVAVLGDDGCGRTSVVRDLARVCGVHCVELSCVPHTTAATAANLVVGSAQSGAWLCIDNAQHCSTRARWLCFLNWSWSYSHEHCLCGRCLLVVIALAPTVLSALAQYISTIKLALMSRADEAKVEGRRIRLAPMFGVFLINAEEAPAAVPHTLKVPHPTIHMIRGCGGVVYGLLTFGTVLVD